jgi:phosphatidylglycerophosphate synthase
VTPNHLTTLRLLSGLTAAGLFAMGGPPWTYGAAAAFVLSVLLDRADGELARSTGRTSAWGHTYDVITDAVVNSLLFVGLGIGLRHGVLGPWAILLGIVAGVAVTATLLMVIRTEARDGPRAAELGSLGGFDVDDAILLAPLAAVLGFELPALLAAAFVTPAFALLFLLRLRQDPLRPAR